MFIGTNSSGPVWLTTIPGKILNERKQAFCIVAQGVPVFSASAKSLENAESGSCQVLKAQPWFRRKQDCEDKFDYLKEGAEKYMKWAAASVGIFRLFLLGLFSFLSFLSFKPGLL